jgi:hypothetical protein
MESLIGMPSSLHSPWRWVDAMNNWRELGQWHFHVSRDPQMLEKELAGILKQSASVTPASR